MTRNPCNGKKDCAEVGCCLNCTQYDGAMEFIPTVLNVNCKSRDPKGENVVLKLHGYPEIDGEAVVACKHWEFYEGKKAEV